MRRLTWVAVVVGTTFVACGSSAPVRSTYFVRTGAEWKLKEAVNPPASKTNSAEPSLDWYAEYERFPAPDRSEMVRLSGHSSALLTRDLASARFHIRRTKVRGRDGSAGYGPGRKPTVVLFEVSDSYTVMALSYELAVPDLVTWVDELRPATEHRWVESGGKIVVG